MSLCVNCALDAGVVFDASSTAVYCPRCGMTIVPASNADGLFTDHEVFRGHVGWVLAIDVPEKGIHDTQFRVVRYSAADQKRSVLIINEECPEVKIVVSADSTADLESARYWHDEPVPFDRIAVEQEMKAAVVPFVVSDNADKLAYGLEGVGFRYRHASQTSEAGKVENHLHFMVGRQEDAGVRVKLSWSCA